MVSNISGFTVFMIVNPRHAYAARVTVLGLLVCVCVSVCLLPRFLRDNKTVIPTGSSYTGFFLKVDFCITTAFKGYGVKTK